MAIRAKYRIKTFPCIRVFPPGFRFGSDGLKPNDTFVGKEYDAHITRTVDTVEDFITDSLKILGVQPAVPIVGPGAQGGVNVNGSQAGMTLAAAVQQDKAKTQWATVSQAFGSFKAVERGTYVTERTEYEQVCYADDDEEVAAVAAEAAEAARRRGRRGWKGTPGRGGEEMVYPELVLEH